jgi:hypothetical protein
MNLANGLHTLTAIARNTAGQTGTSAPVSVSVQNAADMTPPSVAITSLSFKKRTVTISVSVTDNVAVAKVELYLDGKLVGSDTSSPWAFTLNLRDISVGSHVFQARGYDRSGNSAVSAQLQFTK